MTKECNDEVTLLLAGIAEGRLDVLQYESERVLVKGKVTNMRSVSITIQDLAVPARKPTKTTGKSVEKPSKKPEKRTNKTNTARNKKPAVSKQKQPETTQDTGPVPPNLGEVELAPMSYI